MNAPGPGARLKHVRYGERHSQGEDNQRNARPNLPSGNGVLLYTRGEAARAHNKRTASYLLGMPLLPNISRMRSRSLTFRAKTDHERRSMSGASLSADDGQSRSSGLLR